jgi:hypothetical protein
MDEVYQKAWNTDPKTKAYLHTKLEWLCWIGQPLLYDGGLCVNRSLEEHTESAKRQGRLEV